MMNDMEKEKRNGLEQYGIREMIEVSGVPKLEKEDCMCLEICDCRYKEIKNGNGSRN